MYIHGRLNNPVRWVGWGPNHKPGSLRYGCFAQALVDLTNHQGRMPGTSSLPWSPRVLTLPLHTTVETRQGMRREDIQILVVGIPLLLGPFRHGYGYVPNRRASRSYVGHTRPRNALVLRAGFKLRLRQSSELLEPCTPAL
jgi:hypothetical protein